MSWWPWAHARERRVLAAAREVRLGDVVHPGDVVKVVGVEDAAEVAQAMTIELDALAEGWVVLSMLG